MNYTKPSNLHYRIGQAACWLVSKIIFRNKILRNEIKGRKGPFVVIANHECMLDFVNLICANRQPMSFVISQSFYNSVPIKGFLQKMGVIPKQQFQTTVKDMKRMKAVIDHEQPLVIYPAGLMCEDGLSTPIPEATFKFLKWLGADVYVARSTGSYFVMPKWTKGMRPGKTTIDIYKLFDKDELAQMGVERIKKATCDALLFDAYREQEALMARYSKNEQIDGLENVLYVCPHCGEEYSITVKDGNTLYCGKCGYAQTSDQYGFLHNTGGIGPEIRYVSDWSRLIYDNTKEQLRNEPNVTLSAKCGFRMIQQSKKKFVDVGRGELTLSNGAFRIVGNIGEEVDFTIPAGNAPTLPFSPGKHLEIQHGSDIYRCVLDDGRQVMKFINMVKIFYELRNCEKAEVHAD